MFRIVFKPLAIRQLKKMKRYYSATIVGAIEKRLSEEPEKIQGAIKRLRGRQATTFRLRVQDYRVFYDVIEDRVEVVAYLMRGTPVEKK